MMKRAFALMLAALVALVTTPAAAQRVAFVSTNGAISHWPLFAATTTFVTSQGTTSTTWSLGGTLGPLWNDNGGVLEGRNPANSAFVVVRGATPVASNDLTTKAYVDSATGAITIPALTGVATSNGYLQWNGSSFAWTTPSGGFTAGGDLSGSGSSQTVVGLQGFALSAATPATGNGLFWNGSAWTPSAVNLAGGSPWVTGVLPVASLGHGTTGTILITNGTTPTWTGMVGDGNIGPTGSLTVTGIRSNSVPSPSGTNTVLQWSGTAFSWASPAATSVTGSGLWYSATGTLNAAAVGLSGDATIGALSGGNLPITFATVNGNVGTFGSASVVPIITVNAKGLTTAVTTATVVAPLGSATGTLASANGGSGVASPAAHTVLVGEGASPFAVIGPGASGVPLLGGGASADPAFGALSLAGGSSVITGTLPAANGGIGVASPTAHSVLVGEGASAVTPVAIGDAQVLFGQSAADPAPKTIGGDLSCIDTGVCTVNKISGSSPIAITPSTLQWLSTTTAPTITQATPASDLATADLSLTPQAPFASAATNLLGGNLNVKLATPVSGTTFSAFQVQQGGVTLSAIGERPGVAGTTDGMLWLGSGNAPTGTRTQANAALLGETNATFLNAGTTLHFSVGLVDIGSATGTDFQLQVGRGASSNVSLFASSHGSGIGTISIGTAGTDPTSNPTSAGILYESHAITGPTTGLTHRGSGGAIMTMAGAGQGTVNSEHGIVVDDVGFLRLTSITTPAQVYSLSGVPAGSSGYARAECSGRAVVAPTGGATGDQIMLVAEGAFKAIGTTVTVSGGSAVTIGTPDTSMAPMTGLSFGSAPTTILVLMQEGGSNAGTIDYQCKVHFVIN